MINTENKGNITKLPNSEQSSKGKVKTHNHTNSTKKVKHKKMWLCPIPYFLQILFALS